MRAMYWGAICTLIACFASPVRAQTNSADNFVGNYLLKSIGGQDPTKVGGLVYKSQTLAIGRQKLDENNYKIDGTYQILGFDNLERNVPILGFLSRSKENPKLWFGSVGGASQAGQSRSLTFYVDDNFSKIVARETIVYDAGARGTFSTRDDGELVFEKIGNTRPRPTPTPTPTPKPTPTPTPTPKPVTTPTPKPGEVKFRTLFMPLEGQEHPTGARSKSGRLDYITTWAAENKKGILSKVSTTVPAGTYVGLTQVWWEKGQGNTLGRILVQDDKGNQIAAKEFVAEAFSSPEYQRVTIEFSVPKTTAVSMSVDYYNNHYVWLGAMSIQPKAKPIFNIGHRMNAIATVNDAIARGANAVEFDIHPVRNPFATPPDQRSITTGFMVYHYGDAPGKATNADSFKSFLANVKGHFDSGKLAMVIFDLKQTFCDGIGLAPDVIVYPEMNDYRAKVIKMVQDSGLPLDRVVLSIPQAEAGAMRDAIRAAGLPCSIDSYTESYPIAQGTDFFKASESFSTINGWLDTLKGTKADFVGIGKDESVRGEFFRWAYWLAAIVRERDTGDLFKKCYFWTVNTQYGMRQALDYAMDGILTDYPDRVVAVLSEAPYRSMFRLATRNDSLTEVFGRVPVPGAGQVAVYKPKNPVTKNSRISLQSSDNRFLGPFYSGKSYYYPQMAASSEDIQFNGDGNPLKYGDRISIRTNNTGGWKASWKSYNLLGTFSDGVYYYDAGQGDKIVWEVVSLGERNIGDVVDDGDQLRLRNVSYNQFLCRSGNITSTQAGATPETVWTIRKR